MELAKMAEYSFQTVEEAEAERETAEILAHKRLRDEFAIAALPIIQRWANDYGATVEEVARRAYEYADAMMEERDR
jgi:hypothetical protein